MRSFVGPKLLIGGVLLGLSCSGPTPDAPDASEKDPRVYHVQLDRTKKKAKANRIVGKALDWWEERSSFPRPMRSQSSPVTVVWKAPLYRVRVGPFAAREEADSVLTVARRTFPGAFVRPESPSTDP